MPSAWPRSKDPQDALLLERRIDFELDTLSELAEYNEKTSNVHGRDARMKTLAAMLPAELIPLTRAAVGLPSTAEGEEQVSKERPRAAEIHGSVSDYMKQTLAEEILQTVASKLRERS